MGVVCGLSFLLFFGMGPSALAGVKNVDVAPQPSDIKDLPYVSMMTRHGNGFPRDPVNLVFVGDWTFVVGAFIQAGWVPADPHTFRRVTKEVVCILDHHKYPTAPVSHSYLFNRREDMVFECEVGGSPRKRHHIRLWEMPMRLRGVPVWAGAATFDQGIKVLGLTHKVQKQSDIEREFIFETFASAKVAMRTKYIPGLDQTQLKKACGFESDGQVLLMCLEPPKEKVSHGVPRP